MSSSVISNLQQDIDELKVELARKEALIQKHQAKVDHWIKSLSQSIPSSSGATHSQGPARQNPQVGMQSPSAGYSNKASPRGSGGTTSAPLSSPLAHLEQATSNLGASFDRR